MYSSIFTTFELFHVEKCHDLEGSFNVIRNDILRQTLVTILYRCRDIHRQILALQTNRRTDRRKTISNLASRTSVFNCPVLFSASVLQNLT